MNITPPNLPVLPGSPEPGKSPKPLAPVQPAGGRERDLLLERRAVREPAKADRESRHDAEALLNRSAGYAESGENENARSRRALRAYDGVARVSEQEYVSRVLGIDEIA